MLAQPLNEPDKGERGLTCLSPGILLPDNDVGKTQTGVSSPPRSSCALSSSSPSFLPALPRSPSSLNLLTPVTSSLSAPPLSVSSSTPFISPSPCSSSLFSSHFPTSSVSLSPSSSSPAAPTCQFFTVPPCSSFSTPPPPSQSLHSSSFPVCRLSHSSALSASSLSSLSAPCSLFSSAASSVLPSTPTIFSPSHSYPPPVSSSPLHTSAFVHVSHPSPNPPACCSCSSLLPRLLSTHRMEMRRLLRGALSSLGRRLDSLERRSRRKRTKKKTCKQEGEGLAPVITSCNLIPTPTVTCSSSSLLPLNKDVSTSPLAWSSSQSEQRFICRGQEDVREKKRIIKNDCGEEEQNDGRFVGQMRVSVRGGIAKEEMLLTLHDINHRKRKQGRVCPSQKSAAMVTQNGYSILAQSSQNALQLLPSPLMGQDSCQSEALRLSFNHWHFSDFIPPSLSCSQTHLQLRPSSGLAPVLRLSAVSMETLLELLKAGAFASPLRPMKDWTAPPSLSSDHCYVHQPTLSSAFPARLQRKQRLNNITWSFYLPQRQPPPLYSANGHVAPFPAGQSKANPKFVNKHAEGSKRVSQIRIRRATPRETPLTPMGLPKVQRLTKKEFSLEEIYTNKNYKSPTTNRSLETIFEEPREKDGVLLLTGQQRRRRLLLFPDFTQPRKRKRPQGLGHAVAMVPRKRVARRHCQSDSSGDIDLDVMLVERLSALEDFMTRQGLDV